MLRSFYKIEIKVGSKIKTFFQSHTHRDEAIVSANNLVNYEYYGDAEVTKIRLLSGLENKVLEAGWYPIGMTNKEMQALIC